MNPLRGIVMVVMAVGFFTVMGTMVKLVSGRVPAGEAVFFRSLVALPVVLIMLWFQGQLRDGLKTTIPLGHLGRGLAGTLGVGLGFAGLAYISLPEATAIRFASPIFVTIFAVVLLGERVRLFRLSAVVIGLFGVCIILAPRLTMSTGEGAQIGALLTLIAAISASLAHVQVKYLSRTETTGAIVFYFSLTSLCLSMLTAPFGWVFPTAKEFILLMIGSIAGSAGQLLLTASFRYGDASLLSPFTYSSMLWAIVLGFFVFGDLPTVQTLIGAAIVIAAGLAILWREQKMAQN
ncbi:MAG: DMT family transporter [Pseudoruegeria sp.]